MSISLKLLFNFLCIVILVVSLSIFIINSDSVIETKINKVASISYVKARIASDIAYNDQRVKSTMRSILLQRTYLERLGKTPDNRMKIERHNKELKYLETEAQKSLMELKELRIRIYSELKSGKALSSNHSDEEHRIYEGLAEKIDKYIEVSGVFFNEMKDGDVYVSFNYFENNILPISREIQLIERNLRNSTVENIGTEINEIRDRIYRDKNAVFIGTILVLVVSVVLSYVSAYFILKPITALKQAVLKIGGGNLDTRVSVTSRDEIALFADSINTMTDDLKHNIEARERMMLKMRDDFDIQKVLGTVMRISMEPISLDAQLEIMLYFILSIPWLNLKPQGSIHLVSEDLDTVLIMKASLGLSEELMVRCANLVFGTCLCGKAAQTKRMVISRHVDEEHEITFEGMVPHGHYCTPILSGERVLGVLNIYVSSDFDADEEIGAGMRRGERLVYFLNMVANLLASIIERKDIEQKLEVMAKHDTLTGLPNRAHFYGILTATLIQSRRYKYIFALLFLDLDGFKAVNDRYGHDIGDLLLKEVSTRIPNCLRRSDILSRLGGDEFVVLLTRVNKKDEISHVAKRIIRDISEPYIISGIECNIGVSIGISVYPYDGDDEETLLKIADENMYMVKKDGKMNYRFREEGL